MDFMLEPTSPRELAQERERQRQRAEITRRLARPLRGCGEINVQPQFDLGQTGQLDLFNPIEINDQPKGTT